MAMISNAAHLAKANQFHAHWTTVDADRVARGLAGVVLPGEYGLGDFLAEKEELEAAFVELGNLENAVRRAGDDRDAQKDNVRERLRQFRAAGSLHFPQTTYFRALPRLPHRDTYESQFMRPLDEMHSLWTRVNADPDATGLAGPLLLAGGYSVSGLAADLATLRANYQAVVQAEQDLGFARGRRDERLRAIHARMQQYRMAIKLEYRRGQPLHESLPELNRATRSQPAAATLSESPDGGVDAM